MSNSVLPGPLQFSLGQFSGVLSCSVWFCHVQFGSVMFSLVLSCPIQSCPVQYSSVLASSLGFCHVQLDYVMFSWVPSCSTQSCPVRCSSVLFCPVQFSSVFASSVRFCHVQSSPAQSSPAHFYLALSSLVPSSPLQSRSARVGQRVGNVLVAGASGGSKWQPRAPCLPEWHSRKAYSIQQRSRCLHPAYIVICHSHFVNLVRSIMARSAFVIVDLYLDSLRLTARPAIQVFSLTGALHNASSSISRLLHRIHHRIHHRGAYLN